MAGSIVLRERERERERKQEAVKSTTKTDGERKPKDVVHMHNTDYARTLQKMWKWQQTRKVHLYIHLQPLQKVQRYSVKTSRRHHAHTTMTSCSHQDDIMLTPRWHHAHTNAAVHCIIPHESSTDSIWSHAFLRKQENLSWPVFRMAPYRVGSVNFSRRKIGHAHDNSADSENVAGAREPNVHAHFIFRFENGQGNQSFFSIHDRNTAETGQPQAQLTNNWRAMDRACPRGLQRPLEKFD